MGKKILFDLLWDLVKRLYSNEIEDFKHRKEITKLLGEEIWKGEMIPICRPRASGMSNKFFYYELLFDGTYEDRSNHAAKSLKRITEEKKSIPIPEIPEI